MKLLSFRPKGENGGPSGGWGLKHSEEILKQDLKISCNIRDDSDGFSFIDMDNSGRSRCGMLAMTFFLSLRGACFMRHGDIRIRYLGETDETRCHATGLRA
jgi:hypothetical protein